MRSFIFSQCRDFRTGEQVSFGLLSSEKSIGIEAVGPR